MLDELEAGHERQARFIADASHVLRTPATILQGNLQLLKLGDLDAEESRRVMDDLCEEADELTGLLTALLEYERDEGADTSRSTRQSRGWWLATRPRSIILSFEIEPTVLVGSPLRTERAVDNLVRNASQWAESRVHVELRDRRLTVDDDGPGIEAGERERVFERFHRGESAKARPGNGLGLSLVVDASRRPAAQSELAIAARRVPYDG